LGAFIYTLSATASGDELTVKIESIIDQIKTERSSTVRTDAAEKLSALLQHRDRSDIDALEARVIDDIAGLMSDRDDSIRCWGALALGQIGAPAERAVPALERALKEIEPVPGSLVADKSSESCIISALRRITGKAQSFRGIPLAK
jgi:HEAT repeat protein